MTANLALEPPAEELADSDIELSLTEAERSLVETIGLYGDEGWESVARHFPITWRSFQTVPSARATFEQLRAKRLVETRDGRVELTADGRWVARMLG